MLGHIFYSLKSKVQSPKSALNFLGLFFVIFFSAHIFAQNLPTPKSFLGFEPADDKKVADWSQITEYFSRLDKASPRVTVQKFGQTTLGKPMIVAFISAPPNLQNLANYRQISQKLADPRKVKPGEVETLVAGGKTIVAISCSIHSTEIVASQMSMTLAYQLASAQDAETLEILNNTILLLIPSSNPDGIDIVANWYRKTLGTKSEGSAPPELYHHYAGHDNNRDWFMLNLKESQAITKLFWQEWFPQFVYDVHQQGQDGSRFTIPPFFDPPNPNIPPSLLRDVGLVGYKMAADLSAAGYTGIATNASYDTWWHGGFRSAPYYHNSIGILSEAASADLMTPVTISSERLKNARPARGLRNPLETATNFPEAWPGGLWRPKDIAGIELIAARSLLTLAAKYRARYLQNFYNLNAKALKSEAYPNQPMAYLIPAGQPNEENISRMIEILISQGVEVYRMPKELHFTFSDKSMSEYPFGSFLVFLNQPQRGNVQALFERQVYPNRVGSDGQPDVPYDVAGWTLPLQMGVETLSVTAIVEKENERGLEKVTDINQVRRQLNLKPVTGAFAKIASPIKNQAKLGMYQLWGSSMDEGWTRLVFDNFQIPYTSVRDADIKNGNLSYEAIILPSDSEREILSGLNANRYPEEISGGIGNAGAENLKRFVENGGTLICFDESCEMVINKFGLPIKNVLKGVNRRDFYCPGSILRLEVDTAHRLGNGLHRETPAYFINSSAFEITDSARVKSVARYANQNALLSGWLLGEKYLNGKTALAETTYGKGKIILFAFRPQHRGQTWGTFPFIFNALEK
jgi:hypothetical protein